MSKAKKISCACSVSHDRTWGSETNIFEISDHYSLYNFVGALMKIKGVCLLLRPLT